jgi:hypothetical protein
VADQVEIWVRDNRTGEERTLRLGEFRAVWRKGVTVGSAAGCDVVLDDPAVSPRQVLLVALSNHKFLRVLGGGAVRAGGRAASAGQELRVDGTEFRVGPYSLRLLGAGC